MELPKLILICPFLLYLVLLSSLTASTDDVISTCTNLCQDTKVTNHCEDLEGKYDKVKTVDHANLLFICCLGYGLRDTGLTYKSYEFQSGDDLKQLVVILKEIQKPDVAIKYSTCIRDCSSGGTKKWKLNDVKSCVDDFQKCPTYKCPE